MIKTKPSGLCSYLNVRDIFITNAPEKGKVMQMRNIWHLQCQIEFSHLLVFPPVKPPKLGRHLRRTLNKWGLQLCYYFDLSDFKLQCSFRTCLGDIRPLRSPWLSRLPSVTSRAGPSGMPVLSLLFFLSGKIPLLNEQVFAEHLPLSWAAPKAKVSQTKWTINTFHL